jgi:hypothetical protein
MTFQTSLSPIPEEQLAHRSAGLITPIGDALLAKGALASMDWLPVRLAHESKVRAAQHGKTVMRGRVPVHVAPTSRALTLAEAEQRVKEAGVEGRVTVFDGQREEALSLEIEREKDRQRYEQIVAHADQGWGTQLLIGATGVVVDFADPVNLATMVVPGVAVGKVAYGLTKATMKLAPTVSKIIVRAGTGAYEGAVNTALAEPVNFALHRLAGDDYGPADSVNNIVTNAVGGSMMHVLGGAGLDLYRGLRARHRSVPDSTDPVAAGLQQIGALEPVGPPATAGQEQGPIAHAVPGSSPADQLAPATKARGYARDSVLVMPANGASGDRVSERDMVGLKAVLREYDPVHLDVGEGESTSSSVKVFRVARGDDVIVYTRVANGEGGPETFIAERVHADDLGPDLTLSQKKATATATPANADDDRVLYFHPPKALAARFAEAHAKKIPELQKLSDRELYLRFRPSDQKGYTVGTELGQVMHRTYDGHIETSPELRRAEKRHGKKNKKGSHPDSYLVEEQINVELKRDTERGRRSGQEAWSKYWRRRNESTAIMVYDDKFAAEIAELEKRVAKVWENPQASWIVERQMQDTARRAARSKRKKKPDKPKSASSETRNTRKRGRPISRDLPSGDQS